MIALAVIAAPATAQRAATADSAEAAVAEACLAQLDHLRFCAPPKADRIQAVLAEGLAALRQAQAKIPSSESADRALRCQLELMRGSLYLGAAEGAEAADPQRQAFLDKAMDVCRAVRIDYNTLSLSLLSYVQQAHAHRIAGDYQAAYEALAPLTEAAASTRSMSLLELRRLAALARVEVTLRADPIKAIDEAEALQRNPLIARQDAWTPRIDWLLARACAAASCLRRDAGTVTEAAPLRDRAIALLRSEGVRSFAPSYDRLGALASLATDDEPVLTGAEWLQWADALADGNHAEAVDIYRRVQASMSDAFGPASRLALAVALFRHDRFVEAADECDVLLVGADTGDELKAKALQLRAGALMRASQASPLSDVQTDRLQAALLALSDSAAVPTDVRADGLRQWVTITARRGGQAACVPVLEGRSALVVGDAYLSYALAAGRWQAALQRPAGPTAADVARVVQAAVTAEQSAGQSGSPELAARAALLRATALSAGGANGTYAALAVLNEAQSRLTACDATSAASLWLRLRLLLDAGLIDQAAATLPPASADDAPDVIIRLAGLLGDRGEGADPTARARVVALCNRALERLAGDGTTYRRAARRCAAILLKVHAHVDAKAILTRLLNDTVVKADGEAHLACSLMMVEALRQGGSINEADTLLDRLNTTYPDSPEAHLARAEMKLALNLHEEAATACRRARTVAAPGSVPWCRATLQLAKALRAAGHDAAAADILRVSGALYPAFGNAEMKADLKRLVEPVR